MQNSNRPVKLLKRCEDFVLASSFFRKRDVDLHEGMSFIDRHLLRVCRTFFWSRDSLRVQFPIVTHFLQWDRKNPAFTLLGLTCIIFTALCLKRVCKWISLLFLAYNVVCDLTDVFRQFFQVDRYRTYDEFHNLLIAFQNVSFLTMVSVWLGCA